MIYYRDITDRPRITTEFPDEFRQTLTSLNNFVLKNTVAFQQTIADMRSGQPAFEDNQAIGQVIGDVLDLTDNGKDLEYDGATQEAIYDSAEFHDTVGQFQKLKKDDPELEPRRRDIALIGLSIYAERAAQYRQQSKRERKHEGRIA